MLDTIRAWLNGTRDYKTGVSIYNIVGSDDKLKALFSQGYSLYNNFRLQEELNNICISLKRVKNSIDTAVSISKSSIAIASLFKGNSKLKGADLFDKQKRAEKTVDANIALLEEMSDNISKLGKIVTIPNPELYLACKVEADRVYKDAMNKRAVLFSSIPSNKFEDANRQDLVLSRKELAIEMVKLYNWASELYDDADYVKIHGHLPDQPPPDVADIDQLKDYEVKPALDNARKAYNKLKGKEQTPDRVILMQNHSAKIKKLEERWRSLKPKV